MLSFIPGSEIEAHIGVTGYIFEKFSVLPKTLQLLCRHIHLIGLCLIGFGKLHDAVGLGEGKWAEQHSVHNRENCRIRADPQRQRQNGDDSKPGTLRQHPRGESYVLPERVHEPPRRYAPTRASCVSSTILPSNK